MDKRKGWIDQARGLSIFMVVYGHNFPSVEPYIYSFHVPLFFFIAGMFHPSKVNLSVIKRRTKMILVPYFFWASTLFLFWFFLGRKFGKSSDLELSATDNFLGIFYAQGGQQFMDWGIPLWFLPCIFMVFLLFSLIRKIPNRIVSNAALFLVIAVGFIWPRLTGINLPWSMDVAMVALSFYFFGNILKTAIFSIKKPQLYIALLVLFAVHFTAFYFNTLKVDMYRALYGEEALFFISGLAGAMFYVLLFKAIPLFKFLEYIGKHTIVILATHLRALTVIKLGLMLIVGTTVFNFSEPERFLLAIGQIIIIIPVIWLVNKFAPVLDGKVKKA